jgi:hypothetical protein
VPGSEQGGGTSLNEPGRSVYLKSAETLKRWSGVLFAHVSSVKAASFTITPRLLPNVRTGSLGCCWQEVVSMRIPNRNERESEGAWTVSAMLGGDRPTRRDVGGGPDATHDFDIRLDNQIIALEVTSATVAEVASMWLAILAVDWVCPELPESWSITLQAAERGRAGSAVRKFRRKAPPLLLQLSQEQTHLVGDVLHDPDRGDLSARSVPAIRGLRALGARSGGPIGTMTGGPSSLSVGTVGSRVANGSAVHTAVEREAVNNASKLLRADADERQLFLWVDDTDPGCVEELTSFHLPLARPELPNGVDVVWVALWMQSTTPWSNVHALWRYADPTGWQIQRVPQVRLYADALLGAAS